MSRLPRTAMNLNKMDIFQETISNACFRKKNILIQITMNFFVRIQPQEQVNSDLDNRLAPVWYLALWRTVSGVWRQASWLQAIN